MLSITTLHKAFITQDGAEVAAVAGISLDIEQGKFLTLLGPSGCGKTTTLRCVAGLEQPESGRIVIGEDTVFDTDRRINVPVSQRGVGMVFQSYAIWPHMTVFENVAFPLRESRGRRYSGSEIESMVARALEMVRLDGYQTRSSTQLSGGQQQRLALARALVHEPKILLLDEPLSNLDANLREQIRFELKRLQFNLGITTLYVTYDLSEALALSDQIIVMNAGHVVQRGTPDEIYHQPNSEFVAGFIGSTNFLPGKVERPLGEDGFGLVTTAHGPLRCRFAREAAPGDEVMIVTRPENIVLSGGAPVDPENSFPGTVANRVFLGEVIDYLIAVGEQEFRVRARPEWDFAIGSPVHVTLLPSRCVGLPEDRKTVAA